jgi:hypothetical protein
MYGIKRKDKVKQARYEAQWIRKRFKKLWARQRRRANKQYVQDEYQIFLADPSFLRSKSIISY